MNTQFGPDLRAMLWKETKENARWAVLAMIGIALALVFTISHQMGGNDANSFSAVWDSVGLVMTFGAPVVGLAFALLQILPELRCDQWAFLVHRPSPRATLFWGKALAGMGLTVLATLIPLLGLALWAQAPGHIPAPFDPRLLLGGLAAILTGLVFHAAGLLTALRPARWYGSRALPVAVAVVCALLVSSAQEFFQAVLWVVLFLGVLLLAARGSFLTNGHYLQQPRTAKISLGIAFYVGIVATLIAAATVIVSTITTLFPGPQRHNTWTQYQITQGGRILLVTSRDGTVIKATDLSGHPFVLPPSAFIYNYQTFLQEQPLFSPWNLSQERFNSPSRYIVLLSEPGMISHDMIWYYAPRQGQVFTYSLQTRRLLGSLGPGGFRVGDSVNPSRFTELLLSTGHNNVNPIRPLLVFLHSVYLLNTETRSVMPLLVTPSRVSDVTQIQPQSPPGSSSTSTWAPYVIARDSQVSLFSPDGRPLFTTPREYDLHAYPNVYVAMTPDHRRFFFHYSPGWQGGTQRLSSHMTEFTMNGTVVQRVVLPPIPSSPDAQPPLIAALLGLLLPSTVMVATNILGVAGRHSTNDLLHSFWSLISQYPRVWIRFCCASLFSGLFSAVLAWRIGRRCVFTRGGQWAWAVGVFWLGLPGVLLLLSLRDWPARETCPACGRLRVVDRDLCEHCGAVFPAPTRDGTEIFEEAGAASPSGASALSFP